MKNKEERGRIAKQIKAMTPEVLAAEEISEPNENSISDFFRRITELVESTEIAHKEIIACINPEISPPAWTKLRNGETDSSKFGIDNYRRVILFIRRIQANLENDSRDKLDGFEDHLYFSLIKHFDMWERTELHLKSNLPGVYVSYRPTLGADGYVAVGLFFIYRRPRSKAMWCEERVIVRSRPEQLHVSPDRLIRFDGPVIRLKQQYICTMTDWASRLPRYSTFTELVSIPNAKPVDNTYPDESRKVTQLEGTSAGHVGLRRYYSRHYLERLCGWGTLSLNRVFNDPEISDLSESELADVRAEIDRSMWSKYETINREAFEAFPADMDVKKLFDDITRVYFSKRQSDSETASVGGSAYAFDVHPIEIVPDHAKHHITKDGFSIIVT